MAHSNRMFFDGCPFPDGFDITSAVMSGEIASVEGEPKLLLEVEIEADEVFSPHFLVIYWMCDKTLNSIGCVK